MTDWLVEDEHAEERVFHATLMEKYTAEIEEGRVWRWRVGDEKEPWRIAGRTHVSFEHASACCELAAQLLERIDEGADVPSLPHGSAISYSITQGLRIDNQKLRERVLTLAGMSDTLKTMAKSLDSITARSTREFELMRQNTELEIEVMQLKEKLAAAEKGAPEVVHASVPEPPPKSGGRLVTPILLDWLEEKRRAAPALSERTHKPAEERLAAQEAIKLVKERDAFGRSKYGQGLSLGDGRDTFEDLRQELGDALQYTTKLILEGVKEDQIKEASRLVLVLQELLRSKVYHKEE